LTQLLGLAHQPAGMSQRADRNRPVIGRHAAERVTRHQRSSRPKIRGTESSERTRRSGANHEDVSHLLFSG
jgi:hypothetical protein